ncbi:hypothetical protein CUMW_101070 [Citrus unshiu]|nr:hypothetical protein CUMW_101070 [Citrus unshiu]
MRSGNGMFFARRKKNLVELSCSWVHIELVVVVENLLERYDEQVPETLWRGSINVIPIHSSLGKVKDGEFPYHTYPTSFEN